MSGWQTFATALDGEAWASYVERETSQQAMAACLSQFPPDEGYVRHGVKSIETQEVTLLRPWEHEVDLMEVILHGSN